MIRFSLAGALVVLSICAQPTAQTPATQPQKSLAFEVVSIKRNDSGLPNVTNASVPGRFIMINAPTRSLLAFAYPVASAEIVGSPDWATSERYDVQGAADHLATRDELVSMVRALLAARFHLVAHIEQRRRPTYALTVVRSDGRLGPNMRRSEFDCDAVRAANADAARGLSSRPPTASNGAPPCGMQQDAYGPLRSGGISMDQLAATLARAAGRPIVNKTGLTGSFEFTLNFSFGGAGRDGTTDDRPNIFTAIRDQLGLELAPEDNPLDVLVIDHIQRPSEN